MSKSANGPWVVRLVGAGFLGTIAAFGGAAMGQSQSCWKLESISCCASVLISHPEFSPACVTGEGDVARCIPQILANGTFRYQRSAPSGYQGPSPILPSVPCHLRPGVCDSGVCSYGAQVNFNCWDNGPGTPCP